MVAARKQPSVGGAELTEVSSDAAKGLPRAASGRAQRLSRRSSADDAESCPMVPELDDKSLAEFAVFIQKFVTKAMAAAEALDAAQSKLPSARGGGPTKAGQKPASINVHATLKHNVKILVAIVLVMVASLTRCLDNTAINKIKVRSVADKAINCVADPGYVAPYSANMPILIPDGSVMLHSSIYDQTIHGRRTSHHVRDNIQAAHAAPTKANPYKGAIEEEAPLDTSYPLHPLVIRWAVEVTPMLATLTFDTQRKFAIQELTRNVTQIISSQECLVFRKTYRDMKARGVDTFDYAFSNIPIWRFIMENLFAPIVGVTAVGGGVKSLTQFWEAFKRNPGHVQDALREGFENTVRLMLPGIVLDDGAGAAAAGPSMSGPAAARDAREGSVPPAGGAARKKAAKKPAMTKKSAW